MGLQTSFPIISIIVIVVLFIFAYMTTTGSPKGRVKMITHNIAVNVIATMGLELTTQHMNNLRSI